MPTACRISRFFSRIRTVLLIPACCLCVHIQGSAQEVPVLRNELFPVVALSDTTRILEYIRAGKQLREQAPDTAQQMLYTALQNSKRLKFPTGVKQALTPLANMYIAKGAYGDAVRIYQTTIDYCLEVPSLHPALYAMYNNLANVYIKQGDYTQAVANYKLAITRLEHYPTEHSGEVYNNLGGLLVQMQQFEHVPYYLDKAEEAAVLKRDTGGLGSIYGNKSSYFFETGNWDSSVYYAQKTLQLARLQRNTQLAYMALINTGELYRRGKHPQEALEYLREADALSSGNLSVHRSHMLNTFGNTYLDLKRYADAEKYFLEALEGARTQGLKKIQKNALRGLSLASEGMGRYAAGLEYYKAYHALEKAVADEELGRNVSEWELKYRTAEKDRELIAGRLQISRQRSGLRNRNLWIAGISACALLLTGLFVSFYRSARQKRRLQQQQISLLQQQQELEQLKAIMTGEEQERERMARELHDGIGGMLAAIRMNLSAVWERQAETTDGAQLHRILEMLRDTSSEVRRTVHNMLPDILTQRHLEEALLIYCEHLNLSNTLHVDFQCHADTAALDKSAELFLYRISQELLQNIVKHAHASNAWLMIKELNGKLSIIVEDDGAGFDTGAASQGYGLLNLQYRVRALQGTLNIQSHPNRGTTVHVAFDMDKLTQHTPA